LRKFENKLIDEEKLINYMKGYGVALTQKGQAIAGLLVRRRRIAEVFLSHLELDFYSIQKQIYRMTLPNEVSDKIEDQFFKDLKSTRCSHGYLIPDKNGRYNFDQLKSLSEFTLDRQVEIVKIPESPFYFIPKYNPSKTDYFLSIYNSNLVPNQRVRILSRTPKSIEIETDKGIDKIPNRGLADQIFVKEV
jgi:Mn-dependent DtxR family transcriptional regulator